MSLSAVSNLRLASRSFCWLTACLLMSTPALAQTQSPEKIEACVKSQYRTTADGLMVSTTIKAIPDYSKITPQLQKIRQALQKFGVQHIYFVVPPTKSAIYHDHQTTPSNTDKDAFQTYKSSYASILSVLKTSGFQTFDLLDAFRNTENASIYFKKDTHWSQQGANLAAQLLSKDLQKRFPSLYKQIQQNPFSINVKGTTDRIGNIERYLSTACPGFAPEPEKVNVLELVNESNDLLGDPEINTVLVGTSFSAVRLNTAFSENLSVNLSTNVVNEAIDGGGAYASLFDVVMKPEYRQKPPALMVWELPSDELVSGQIRLDDPVYLRQAIPTILQNGKKLTADQDLYAKEGVFTYQGAKSNGRMYFKILFKGSLTRKFDLVIDYGDKQESFKVSRIQGSNIKEYYFDALDSAREIKNIKIMNAGTSTRAAVTFFEYPAE